MFTLNTAYNLSKPYSSHTQCLGCSTVSVEPLEWIGMQQTHTMFHKYYFEGNAGLKIQEINKTKKLQFVVLLLWRGLLCSVTLCIDKDIAQKSQ